MDTLLIQVSNNFLYINSFLYFTVSLREYIYTTTLISEEKLGFYNI